MAPTLHITIAIHMQGEPIVRVRRGPIVESLHSVAACAIGPDGQTLLSIGDTESNVYLRSAAKPFIAAVAVQAGVVERFGLDRREIAIMAASHNGEPFHIAAVGSILRKIGLGERALQCGAHPPYDDASAATLSHAGLPSRPIHNNCSGKHVGILALCKAIGADPSTYMERSNAAQDRILATCAQLSGERVNDLVTAVDGCGIPVYATSLRNAALSYMRLATLSVSEPSLASALKTVREAMMEYPEYMSGTGEFDAALMRVAAGAIVCKGGAEGIHGSALLRSGTGLVLKVLDGSERARPPAAVMLLERLGALSSEQLAGLAPFSHPSLRNRAGRVVGDISASAAS